MAKKTYAEKLRDPRWQKRRLEILQRDNWTCTSCGDSDTELHIHHLKYNGNPWDAKDEDLVTQCKHCHALIEYLKNVERFGPEAYHKVKIEKRWTAISGVPMFFVYAYDMTGFTGLEFYSYEDDCINPIFALSPGTLHHIHQKSFPFMYGAEE
jgi:hypothetical protein